VKLTRPPLEALNYGFEIGQLSVSQTWDRIKLIPKKSKELLKLERAHVLKL